MRLTSPTHSTPYYQSTDAAGSATFPGVHVGPYMLEVSAPGYRTVNEETLLTSLGTNHAFIDLRPEGAADKDPPQNGVPLLVGKARKELDLAMVALRADKPAEASKHIEYALKHASGNPDVQYAAALWALGKNDVPGATQHLEAAIRAYPDHFGSRMALGQILLQQRNFPGAVAQLESAVALDPSSWRGHQFLAEAFLRSDPAKAKFHAARAPRLRKG